MDIIYVDSDKSNLFANINGIKRTKISLSGIDVDAYNRKYERLIAKYTYEEVAANWKPFAEKKSNLSYHRKK
ncbi:hypothetical protein BpHYR1_035334 [Brachionus plicatilis]|uniref:Uncharacterized protein n=1 Tax=Brachionus plicatilis TaxID=10195 RepID=A0A3M7SAQ5_BRAPC|nr:hypothetical protein BpHYR1_035334 [Brachionus plicatilis]